MENNSSPVFRIDEQVFFTMICLSILSLFVLAYRYKNAEPCEALKLNYRDGDIYAGTYVTFKAEVKNGKSYEWNFGDNKEYKTGKPTESVVFSKPGIYTVTVLVNRSCRESRKVYIKEQPLSRELSKTVTFTAPDTAYINRVVTFTDATKGATKWEWFLDEKGTINNTNKQATWIFKEAGLKTVYLRVNGLSYMESHKDIVIVDPRPKKPVVKIEKPKRPARKEVSEGPGWAPIVPSPDEPAPTPPPVMTPNIDQSALVKLVEEIVIGKKTASDFSRYLCDDLVVTYNNKRMTVSEMCNKLREWKNLRKIKTPEVHVRKNTTNCIKEMAVTVKKETLLDKIF
jgi:hypothetical protein